MARDIFNRADPTRNEIQARGAAAARRMAQQHPSLFRRTVIDMIRPRSRLEKLIHPFRDDENMDMRDPRLRPLIVLAVLLPRETLRDLRLVSKTTYAAVDFMLPRLFRTIHILREVDSDPIVKHMDGLLRIGNYCRELVVSLSPRASVKSNELKIVPQRTSIESAARSSGEMSQHPSSSSLARSPTLQFRRRIPAPVDEAVASRRVSQKASLQSLGRIKDAAEPTVHPALRDVSPSDGPLISSEPTQHSFSWTQLFRSLPNLHTLTITICKGDTGWHALTFVERILVDVRTALEKSCGDPSHHTISRLHTLRLAPTTPMSIVPMRWAGLAAMSNSGCSEWWTSFLWTSLTVLELQMLHPHPYFTKSQTRMFRKILHDYLSSFKDTLKSLRFAWLGQVGPNPLLLDLEAQLDPDKPGARSHKNFSQPAIVWEELREVWLGAVPVGPFTATVMASRAEKLERIMTLPEAFWMDLEPGQVWDLQDPTCWRNVLGEYEEVPLSEAAALDEIEKYGQVIEDDSEPYRSTSSSDDGEAESENADETEDHGTRADNWHSRMGFKPPFVSTPSSLRQRGF
ncbi:MAG: hypothetical protein M1822_001170 [Bathelium mastoideum]|nr:MAG: hypothetical protein M1822_001170 [Bathelium mastoideum]